MSRLKHALRERFCQEVAKGKSYLEAGTIAGFSPNRGNLSVMARRPEVQARIKELAQAGAKRAEVTIASLIEEADEIQRAAMEEKQFSAATSALTAKAKLAGLWVEKSDNTNRNVDPTAVSDAELAAVVAGERGQRTSPQKADTSKLN